MRAPTIDELPPPPSSKTGWPWSEESIKISEKMCDGKPWPKISIVTPSYNQGNFIEETIRSVLLQGYPDLEYIIIDGGSKDESLDIIRRYEPWLTSWVCEPDRGQANAINKGFAICTGQIVAWLNSDDLYFPNALSHIAEAFRLFPKAVMVYGSGRKIDSQGNQLKEIPSRPFNPDLIRTRYYILQQSSFFKREALLEAGLLNEELNYFMDWELTIRLSMRGEIISIPEPIGMFRIHNLAKTQLSGWERFYEIAKIGRKYNGFIDKNFIAYWILTSSRWIHSLIPLDREDRLGKISKKIMEILFKRDTYMIH